MSSPGTDLDPDLLAAIDAAASAPRLLVVSDFDGTLAPFVNVPSAARAVPAGMDALIALAATPGATVALLSGRALDSLRAVSGSPEQVELVGSHGGEWSRTGSAPLTDVEAHTLAQVRSALHALAAQAEGAHVEDKPTAAVLHVRPVTNLATQERLLDSARRGPGTLAGVQVTDGKGVVEFAVREACKGGAVRTLLDRTQAQVGVFLGDDVTDEGGFQALGTNDLTVKVGDGATAARFRVADISGAVGVLCALAAARAALYPG